MALSVPCKVLPWGIAFPLIPLLELLLEPRKQLLIHLLNTCALFLPISDWISSSLNVEVAFKRFALSSHR